jgi:hypothetical protein
MRIVKRKEFLALPVGTIFSKYYTMGIFNGLNIKGETWGDDFLYLNLIDNKRISNPSEMVDFFEKAEADSSVEFSMNLDEWSRDGLYEVEQLFAVYDNLDKLRLINKISSE